jgi:hypothetical protein
VATPYPLRWRVKRPPPLRLDALTTHLRDT